MTESKCCAHCGKMLAQTAFLGVSAFCLSTSATVSSELISAETTVVMLRPDAGASFASGAAPYVDADVSVVFTRPIHSENLGASAEASQSGSDFETNELSLAQPGIFNAEEILLAPRLRPSGSETVAFVLKERSNASFTSESASSKPSTIANHEAAAAVPRMTKDVLLAYALEEFSEGDYSGDLDFDLELVFENLSESPDGYEAAPVPRPQYFGELHCLAEAIYFEARGENATGQQAVAEVIINRVNSDKFPDRICEVVTQGGSNKGKCQFSFKCDGLPESISEKDAYAEVRMMAFRAMHGEIKPVAGGATYFHATWANPRWAGIFEKTAEIGSHVFYQERIN